MKDSVVVLFAAAVLMALPCADAAITCGAPIATGTPNEFEVTVTTSNANFTSVGAAVLTGGVTETGETSDVGAPACQSTPPAQADSSCTFTVLGVAGGGPQSWSRSFQDGGLGATVCSLDNDDGLPVELVSFSVE